MFFAFCLDRTNNPSSMIEPKKRRTKTKTKTNLKNKKCSLHDLFS